MKRFKNFNLAALQAIVLPMLLIVPNVALCVTEQPSWWSALINIILPWSVYSLIMSLWKRTGLTTLFMLPFMIFAGFQIVLLYLYGGSIIAVDMFLNVVTTNATEVSELLGNLIFAIGVVILLFIPPLVISIVLILRKIFLPSPFMGAYRRGAIVAVCLSVILLIGICLNDSSYRPSRELFPVNVTCNLFRAIKRTTEVSHYEETSADFSYNAKPTHQPDMPEVYLLVIGETSRGENWQLLGYDRPTNPELSNIDSLIVFKKAVTQSNTTHKSVPMIISSLSAENFDSIAYHKSIITAFKEAGFHTYLFSNQTRNRSHTEHFCNEADEKEYIKDRLGRYAMDHHLLDNLQHALDDTLYNKKFIILHTYGSHFNYRDRYSKEYAGFVPDEYADANVGNRDLLINAYDNTILYIDSFLAKAINQLKQTGVASAMLYTADHGEDIFDDSRERFLHASPTPTFHQLYVPMMVWISGEYNEVFGNSMYNSILSNSQETVSPTAVVFPTIISLAGIDTPYYNKKESLTEDGFKGSSLIYITDLNEAVPVTESGIKEFDKKLFREKQIDI